MSTGPMPIIDHHFPGDDLNNAIQINHDPRDSQGGGGASHHYFADLDDSEVLHIDFQHGPRDEPGSQTGVTDAVLIAILLDRYRAFQAGPFRSRENAVVITKLEEALMWMQKRTLDRQRRGVLGKSEK